MKNALLIFVVGIFLMGCKTNQHPTLRDITIQWSTLDGSDLTLKSSPNKIKFNALKDLIAFAATLPSGSVVRWDSGCVHHEVIRLADSEMSIQDFTAYCEQRGVKFEYVVSGY